LERCRQREMVVRSLYTTGPLITVAREVAKCSLDSVGIKEVRWDTNGIEPAGDYALFCVSCNENHELGTGFFIHKRIISQLGRLSLLVIGCRM
jgi:hypothetical protein